MSTEIKIRKGIPVPGSGRKVVLSIIYKMEEGDSIEVELPNSKTLNKQGPAAAAQSMIRSFQHKGYKFATRSSPCKKKIEIWLLKKPDTCG